MSNTIKNAILAAKARVSAAYDAIVAKGGTRPTSANLANLPSAISAIPSGGETFVEAECKDVNFIDPILGCIYSYTLDEFAALTEMPTPKEHDLLTFDSWCKCGLVSNNLADYQDGRRHNIGATYYTTDGKVHAKINGVDYVKIQYVQGIIEWGDGSSSSSSSSNHQYSTIGNYEIVITPTNNAIDFAQAYYNAGYQFEYIYLPQSITQIAYFNTKIFVGHSALERYNNSYKDKQPTSAKCLIMPSAGIPYQCSSAEWVIAKKITSFSQNSLLLNGFQNTKALEIGNDSALNIVQGSNDTEWVSFTNSLTTTPTSGYYFVQMQNCKKVEFGENFATIPTNFLRYNEIHDLYLYQTAVPTLQDYSRFGCGNPIVHIRASVGVDAYLADTNWAAWFAASSSRKIIADL